MSCAWMPWYIGDYLRDTLHLTTEQHGAYLLLIAYCWQHGALPPGADARATIARLSPHRWKTMSGCIERFFEKDGTHKRVSLERKKAEENVAKKTMAAAVRWGRRRANG